MDFGCIPKKDSPCGIERAYPQGMYRNSARLGLFGDPESRKARFEIAVFINIAQIMKDLKPLSS